ncbi:hypothetical protein ACS0TY_022168 [Phlomoides rotata]
MKVKALLIHQGLGAALRKEEPSDKGKTKVEDLEEIQEKTYNMIILCLGDKALREVSKETTTVGVWEKLEGLYNLKTLVNRLYMKQKLFSFRMVEEKSILKQVGEFNKLLDDFQNIEVQLDEEDNALLLLSSLPKSLDNFKDTLLFGSRDTITLDQVEAALKCKDLQKATVNGSSQGNAESLHIKKGSTARSQFKKSSFKGNQKADKKSGNSDMKCFQCQESGHVKKQCPKWQEKMTKYAAEDAKEAQKSQANQVAQDAGYESCEALCITSEEICTEWVLDSGCSFHMTHIREWFSDLQLINGGTVLLGNNQVCKVMGIRSVKIKMHDGVTRLLTNVRYVPELRRNLISLGLLDTMGYSFASHQGIMTVSREGKVVIEGNKKSQLYFLVRGTITGQAHSRLGHVGEKGLQESWEEDQEISPLLSSSSFAGEFDGILVKELEKQVAAICKYEGNKVSTVIEGG